MCPGFFLYMLTAYTFCYYVQSMCLYQDMRKSMLCGIWSRSRHSRSVLAGRGLASNRRAPRSLPIQAYLSPYTQTHTHTHTHKQVHTQISQEQKIKLEAFGNTLPQHIDTFGHTQLETHTDTHKKAFSDTLYCIPHSENLIHFSVWFHTGLTSSPRTVLSA